MECQALLTERKRFTVEQSLVAYIERRGAGCPSLYQLITSEPEPAVEQSDDRCLRSESQQLAAFSVGLRRSEIDGHFENCRLTPPA